MKTLFVLRHAKSSWDDASLADFDRPLNNRGKNAAPFMGSIMAERNLLPDVIFSSPAVRARETARLVKDAGSLEAEIRLDERIYEASPPTLRQVAMAINDEFRSAMIVGHNPGMEGFIRLLTGRLEAMPTAALAIIDLDIARWEDIIAERATLRQIIRPKDEIKTNARGG